MTRTHWFTGCLPSFPLFPLSFFIVLAVLLAPMQASAIDGTEPMGFKVTDEAVGPFPSMGTIYAQDGAVAYCLNQERPSPSNTDYSIYDRGWEWLNDAYAAVAYYGYPSTTTIGGRTLSEGDARAATQIATWMVSGTVKEDGTISYRSYSGNYIQGTFAGFTDIIAAAQYLYRGATTGSLKAPHNRVKKYIGIYDSSKNTDIQNILYVVPTVTVRIEKKSSNTAITASNGEYTLKGCVLDIYESSNDKKVASVTTDANGCASCELSPNTAYYAVEAKAPKGFVESSSRRPFSTSSDSGGLSITDTPKTLSIKLAKVDAATGGSAQKEASLAGAVYRCVSLSTAKWTQTATTDGKGNLTFKDIPLGTCVVTEAKAPVGYLPDTEEHRFTVSDDESNNDAVITRSLTVKETPIAFDIEIAKFKDPGSEDSGKELPVEGVRFELISNTTGKVVGSVTTNAKGYADTSKDKNLWFGEGERPSGASGAIPYDQGGYTVHEVASTVPFGYQRVDDWTLPATEQVNGAKLQYIVDNHAISTRLQIIKVDSQTGCTVPLAGFSFCVLDSAKNPITQTNWYPTFSELSTFTTDETGTVTLPQRLVPGIYYIREMQAQAPYLLNDGNIEVTIPNDADAPSLSVATVGDTPATGKAVIHKTEKGSGTALAGAEFDIVARETIMGAEDTVQAVKDEVLGHITTDEDGYASITGLPLGKGVARYAFVETKAPDGYLLDPEPLEFGLSYLDQDTAEVVTTVEATNDYTKLDISKVEITGGDEIPGAHIEITDSDDRVIDSWVSEDKSHRIEHLEPGTYTLRETLTPRTHDNAEQIAFTVKETGEVQHVEMKDQPIEISTRIDKRQQIAKPVANDTTSNGDGKNTASEQTNEDGSFSYTIDFENTSNTWVDEFTVEDVLDGTVENLAHLVAIETPQAGEDFNKLLNVWYKTNKDAGKKASDSAIDDKDAPEANATLDDKHENPWLSTEEVKHLMGDDARALDYTGWHLWKRDVSTDVAETLKVDGLELDEDEYVCAIRFEFGGVKQGFSSRAPGSSDWDRKELKSLHDDIDTLPTSQNTEGDEKSSLNYRPAIVHMKVTKNYVEGTTLKNETQVYAFRNGGGDHLEDHDSDNVQQTPRAVAKDLVQTGMIPFALLLPATAVTAVACIVALHHLWKRR